MSQIQIAKVKVTWVDFHAPETSEENLSLRFNCWDEAGDALPGLGGTLNSKALAHLLKDNSLTARFRQLVLDTARRWVADYDLYAGIPAGFKIIQVQRKDEGSHSMNVEFWRVGDEDVASALLLEYYPGYPVAHNRKRQYSDSAVVQSVRDDIARIMDAADALALAACQQRKVEKKEGKWQVGE